MKNKIQIILKRRLTEKISKTHLPAEFLSTRNLSAGEMKILREQRIKRFYLPLLKKADRNEFFKEFDRFWDSVVAPFDQGHPFWLNVVSSKMQECEHSAGYLALTLFTLTRMSADKDIRLLIITSSLEEDQILKVWARKQDWSVISTDAYCPGWIRGMARELINTLKFVYYAITTFRDRSFLPKLRLPQKSAVNPDSVLIASLSYPWAFKKNEYLDPFFGDLHRLIQKNNGGCFYLSELLDPPDAAIAQKISNCNEEIVFFPSRVLTFMELMKTLFGVFFTRIEFSRNDFMECDFSGLLRWNARRFMYRFNIHARIYFAAVSKLCKKYNFSRLLYIHEGNVFERACIQAFRKYSHGRVDGYCHSAIYELNIKYRLTAGEASNRPEPDRYICPGPYSRELLSTIGGRPVSKIRLACTLKEIPSFDLDHLQSQPKTLLVGLEGLLTSTYLLDWLIEHKDCFEGVKVLIREHPNMPVKRLLKGCIHELPADFEIAKNLSLEECMQKSFCVLYRLTSLGMQALLSGVPVIYLEVDTPLRGDPMEELKIGRWKARDSNELKAALGEISRLDSAYKAKAQEQAKDFAEEFFSAPTDEKLKQFIGV